MNAVREIEFAQYGATNVHPIALIFLLFTTVLVLRPKRSTTILGVLIVSVFMPAEQRLVIAGLDFSMLRIITIIAWTRVLIKAEYRGLRRSPLDRWVVLWVLCGSLLFVLRVGPSGIVNRLGVSFDVLAAYFLVRMLVRTPGEVSMVWREFAWLTIALSPLLLYETVSLYNPFSIFDYPGLEDVVRVRDGRSRAQGPFSHNILAGTFGSMMLPVFIGMRVGWTNSRHLFGVACIAATVIVLAAGSSGAAVAWAFGVFGWGIWRLRRRVPAMLWASVLIATVIHFVREQPVWHLIGRLSAITGGTGHHRFRLIDAFFRHLGEWVLVGTDNMMYWGWGLQDVTNYYVLQAVSGGLVTLVVFIVILRVGFRELRRGRESFEGLAGAKNRWALLTWGSSVALTVHCVSFISVSYFGQMRQLFLMFLATIPALVSVRVRKSTRIRTAPMSTQTAGPIQETPMKAESAKAVKSTLDAVP